MIINVDKPIKDDLFYIAALFCENCNEWRDFHFVDAEPHCDCCHEKLIATDEDFETVANRSPRARILRLKNNVA